MKKFKVLTIILVVLLLLSCAKKEKDGLSTIIPSETQVYLKIPSLSSLFQNLAVAENSILGKPVPNISLIEAGLGFNPLKLEDLQTQGIDVNRSIGLILTNIKINSIDDQKPDINAQGMLFFPVTDYGKVTEFIKNTIGKIEPEFEIVQKDDRTAIYPGKEEQYFVLDRKNNYLVVTISEPISDSNALLDAVLAGDSSLAENDNYQAVTSKIDHGENIFVYVDTQNLIDKFLPKIMASTKELPEEQKNQIKKGLEFIKDYLSAGFSIDITSSDFRLESILTLKPESQVLKMMGDVEFNKDLMLGIDKTPLMIISFAFNLTEYLNILMETFPPQNKEIFEEAKEKFYAQTGLKLEEDIIGNLAGSFNLGIFDGENLNITNSNTLISIGIKDENKAANMMEILIKNLPSQQQALIQKEEVLGTDAYVATAGFFRIFSGIKSNNIFMTAGQPMFETIVSGKPSSGFISKIQDKKLAEVLAGDYSIFYINIDELMKAQKNLANFIGFFSKIGQKITNIASQFEYLLIYSGFKDSTFYSEHIVKTRFDKPFIQGIMNIFSQIKN